MASKALLRSIVISSVHLELMQSFSFCVRLVRNVVVKWCGLKPCCVRVECVT